MLPQAPVNVQRIPEFLTSFSGKMDFETKGTPAFVLKYKKFGLVEKDEQYLMEQTEEILRRFKTLYE